MLRPNMIFPTGLSVYVPPGKTWQNYCPDASNHDPDPANVSQTTGLSKTHRQAQCPTCGLWVQWLPRKKRSKK
jgi:hypothetical protein